MPNIATVVGEASGDWIAALVIESLLESGGFHFEGVAGPRLRELGVKPLASSEELSVMGYAEVLRKLPALLRLRKRLINHWITTPPSLYLGVDAPDFNLTIEQKLKEAGVPVIHMVCPTIWAWRKERTNKIKACCDHVLCLFPFEPEILRAEGIDATFIGHPMATRIPLEIDTHEYRRGLGLPINGQYLALLPGSRASEVKLLSPVFIEACQILFKELPELKVIAPSVNSQIESHFLSCVPSTIRDRFITFQGRSHEVLGASDAVLLASGTAALEAMMFKKPMVISYKVPWLTYQIAKRKEFYLPYYGLPNILSERFVVPELMQEDATPEKLAEAVRFQLTDEKNRAYLKEHFTNLHHQLRQDSGAISKQVVQEYL